MMIKTDFKTKLTRIVFYSTTCLLSANIAADEFSHPVMTYSQSDFGGVGLLQMPTARMKPEGEFTFGTTYNSEYTHYTGSLQLFSWLESTIRYTQVHDVLYSSDSNFSGDTDYTDKSIDVKLGLLSESYWLPELSVGAQDIGGTGLFDGEYVVANKRYKNLDFTLGVGWGYIGNSANLSGSKSNSSDCGRNTSYSGDTGTVDLNRMFTGCSALFGGVQYQTAYQPLQLKLEYDGNDYQSDFPVTSGSTDMPSSTPWNFGLVYSPTDWAVLRVSYERGNTLTAGISLKTNLSTLKPTWVDTPSPNYKPQPAKTELTTSEWKKLNKDIQAIAGYEQTTLYQSEAAITLKGKPTKYRNLDEAHQRASYLIADTGLESDKINIIDSNEHLPLTETTIHTAALKRVAENDYPDSKFQDSSATANPQPILGEVKTHSNDDWSFGVAPVLQQSFGGSEDFYLYAIALTPTQPIT